MDKKLVQVLFISSLLIILTLTLISYLRFTSFNDFNKKIRTKSIFSVQLKKIEREFMTMVAFQRSFLVGEQEYHKNAYENAKLRQFQELENIILLSKSMEKEVLLECEELTQMVAEKVLLMDKEVSLVSDKKKQANSD